MKNDDEVVGEIKNKTGLLRKGSIVNDLHDKEPFGSKKHELMTSFLFDLNQINPELFKKLITC